MLEHDMDLGGGQLVYQKEKFFLHSKEVGKNGGKKKKKKKAACSRGSQTYKMKRVVKKCVHTRAHIHTSHCFCF